MLCHSGSADSTRAALHFANAAKRVVMRPKLNEVTNEKAVIRTMLAEIALLKDKLVSTTVACVVTLLGSQAC